eukprot:7218651-Pyramimonas_sp.AAC.1
MEVNPKRSASPARAYLLTELDDVVIYVVQVLVGDAVLVMYAVPRPAVDAAHGVYGVHVLAVGAVPVLVTVDSLLVNLNLLFMPSS